MNEWVKADGVKEETSNRERLWKYSFYVNKWCQEPQFFVLTKMMSSSETACVFLPSFNGVTSFSVGLVHFLSNRFHLPPAQWNLVGRDGALAGNNAITRPKIGEHSERCHASFLKETACGQHWLTSEYRGRAARNIPVKPITYQFNP